MQSYNDEYGRLHFYTRPNNIALHNTLSKWVEGEMSKSSRKKLVYENVIKYGSVLLSHNAQAKGQRMGCLLCKLGTDCIHGVGYTPTRKALIHKDGKVSIDALGDWVDWEAKEKGYILPMKNDPQLLLH